MYIGTVDLGEAPGLISRTEHQGDFVGTLRPAHIFHVLYLASLEQESSA